MKLSKTINLSVLLLIFCSFVFSQDETPIRVETNFVNINVSVFDKKGKFVEGLSKENFEVFDNGVKQKLEYFSSENAPVSFGIIYDMHPTTEERTKAVLESLREFTKGLPEQDDFFTLVFNKRGTLLLGFVPTAEQIRVNLQGKFREPNALYDAIYKATKVIAGTRNHKRVLLVITDSADHNSEHRFNDIEKQLKKLDVQVYTILWDEAEKWRYADVSSGGESRSRVSSDASGLSRAALEELALRTGGMLRSPTVQNANELYRIYGQIAFETRQQYTLGFYPSAFDGSWHNLKIGLRSVSGSRKMALTYRQGYQSPQKN
ncbi:MAG: VWA domain-containing protein [Acidobacteria bacterium]|nr:VWA domain-containing protein [Acidobacteriota bacterium]